MLCKYVGSSIHMRIRGRPRGSTEVKLRTVRCIKVHVAPAPLGDTVFSGKQITGESMVFD